MRTVLAVSLLALLSVAGSALASDYMLPSLLQERARPAMPAEPASGDQSQASVVELAPNSGMNMAAALFGAAVVVLAAFVAFRPKRA